MIEVTLYNLSGDKMTEIAELVAQLDDPDPEVRQDVAIALGDLGSQGKEVVPLLIQRLRSAEVTPHDRACAAWALGEIAHDADQVVPVLLAVLKESADQHELGELRNFVGQAIVSLAQDQQVLLAVAQLCLMDRHWKCKMLGLALVKRLGDEGRELWPLVEPHLQDEVFEIRSTDFE